MKYRKHEAKDYARSHMRGIFAAANTPFRPGDLALDEAGLRRNMRHWIDDLAIEGLFVGGAQTVLSCSDQNLDVVIELARYAEAIGGDYIVVHAPVLNFHHAQDDSVREYYRYIASQVSIGIALWSHPDSGYVLSPELCAELADIETVVAIKYSVDRELYAKLTRLAGDRILVSTASEEEWFDNIVELGWQLYLCSSPPYTLQTAADRRMREYTELAMAGNVKEARRVRDSLNPVRQAIRSTRPPGKPFSHQKYWQELLGQVGGPVRRPLLELSEAEKSATRAAFEACGLTLNAAASVAAE
jgi:4-hydroxy-tetrahydrodipicolinate synthase